MRRPAALLGLLALLFSGYVTACGVGDAELQPGETGRAQATTCVDPDETLRVQTVETVGDEMMTGTIIIERGSRHCAGLVKTAKEPTTTFVQTAVSEQE